MRFRSGESLWVVVSSNIVEVIGAVSDQRSDCESVVFELSGGVSNMIGSIGVDSVHRLEFDFPVVFVGGVSSMSETIDSGSSHRLECDFPVVS